MRAPAQDRPPPSEPVRLLMAGAMALVKGGLVAAIVVAPFFGVAAAPGAALGFSVFCVWLAHRAGPGSGGASAGAANRK